MNIKEIEQLLTLFYNGQTTESQEEALRIYFETEDVPEHLLMDKRLVLSMHTHTTSAVPSHLEKKLSDLINEQASASRPFLMRYKKQLICSIGGLAAGLALLCGMNLYIDSIHVSTVPVEPRSDQKAVCQLLQSTLMEVSEELNNGISEVKKSQKQLDNVHQEIKKEIK